MEFALENIGFLEKFVTCTSDDLDSRPFLALALSVIMAKFHNHLEKGHRIVALLDHCILANIELLQKISDGTGREEKHFMWRISYYNQKA